MAAVSCLLPSRSRERPGSFTSERLVEDVGCGEDVADEDAKNDDRGMEEFVEYLAFVGHGRRVNDNARMVHGAVQIVLKIGSNVSGEKIKAALGARPAFWPLCCPRRGIVQLLHSDEKVLTPYI
jgi:hypothetical protein